MPEKKRRSKFDPIACHNWTVAEEERLLGMRLAERKSFAEIKGAMFPRTLKPTEAAIKRKLIGLIEELQCSLQRDGVSPTTEGYAYTLTNGTVIYIPRR